MTIYAAPKSRHISSSQKTERDNRFQKPLEYTANINLNDTFIFGKINITSERNIIEESAQAAAYIIYVPIYNMTIYISGNFYLLFRDI